MSSQIGQNHYTNYDYPSPSPLYSSLSQSDLPPSYESVIKASAPLFSNTREGMQETINDDLDQIKCLQKKITDLRQQQLIAVTSITAGVVVWAVATPLALAFCFPLGVVMLGIFALVYLFAAATVDPHAKNLWEKAILEKTQQITQIEKQVQTLLESVNTQSAFDATSSAGI